MIIPIKKEIIKLLGTIANIQDLADFEKNPPDGLPMVTVTLDSHDNAFETSAENARKWVYSIKVFEQIGKDINNNEAKHQAEVNMMTLIEQIVTLLGQNIKLPGDNISDFSYPAIGTSGYVEFDIGWARFYEITYTVYQSEEVI
jgi:hypothetical protein